MTDDLNSILKQCAIMRGVPNLIHRVLIDFSSFVECIVYNEHKYGINVDYYRAAIDWNNPDALLEFGKCFLEYYKEESKKWMRCVDSAGNEIHDSESLRVDKS